MGNLEFVDYQMDMIDKTIINPKIDGVCKNLLEKHMLESSNSSQVEHIFSNAYKTLPYLIDPTIEVSKKHKVLCVGKVQSGKTAFFISSIALAFDNGYNLVYVIGGTKIKLKDQNYDRLSEEFSNNKSIKIVDINEKDHEEPTSLLSNGYKVIIVVLKNISSEIANLGLVETYSHQLKDVPSIIIDDEGDEYSPGAPKLKNKNPRAGRVHDVLLNIVDNIRICTFFSVTATPQANFLISTIDDLSPDFAILVEPGDGYTGGNAFHDIYDNPHVIEIKDSNSFDASIPQSFKDAFNFFVFSVITQRYRNNFKEYSMLVHPSSLTKVQSMVVEKIRDYFSSYYRALNNIRDISFDDYYNDIYDAGKEAVSDFSSFEDFKVKTIDILRDVLAEIEIYEFNVSKSGRESIENEGAESNKYKVYVGGNMLGRGLTIKNLNVTYMYRDSKISQIDTLYQRARWFGYKKAYFDLCRVFMTRDLKNKFIDTVESENDMWNSLNSFLMTKVDIKSFPRIFSLKNDKLRLTRASVSKTVMIERVNPGYVYDKSIALTEDDIINNRKLYKNYYMNYKEIGSEVQFGNSKNQQHFVVETRLTDFYNEFVIKYRFPRGSNFGLSMFNKLIEQVNKGAIEDKIVVLLMRYKTGEYRSPIANNQAIKELPQSWDSGTEYPGDKWLTGYENVLHIQLHPVYITKDSEEEIIPVMALNNPITGFSIRYVTGDNYYE